MTLSLRKPPASDTATSVERNMDNTLQAPLTLLSFLTSVVQLNAAFDNHSIACILFRDKLLFKKYEIILQLTTKIPLYVHAQCSLVTWFSAILLGIGIKTDI